MPLDAGVIVTAPAIYKQLSVRYIDASGDKRADSYRFPSGTSLATIQGFLVALGAVTQANLYEAQIVDVFGAVPDASDATAGDRSGVENNVVVLTKKADGSSVRMFIPAPAGSIMLADADEIDPASTPLGDLFAAWLSFVGAGWEITQARYSSRRQTNEATKI